MKLKHVKFFVFISIICLSAPICAQNSFSKIKNRQSRPTRISRQNIEVTQSQRSNTNYGDNLKELVRGNNQFAFELYEHIKNTSKNIFFSPYSISSALGMTFAGTKGYTEEEIAKTLHFNIDQIKTHQSFYKLNKVFDDIQTNGHVKLSVANSIWLQNSISILQSYLDLTSKYYAGTIKLVDFNRNAENARQTINKWIENKTNSKITDLLQSGDVTSDTELVLCNAIYFKGNWCGKFDKADTKELTFYLDKGGSIKCPTMNKIDHYKCHQFDGFSAISVPYNGRKLSMVIFLPDNPNGLLEFEERFTSENVKNWVDYIENLETIKVDLKMPKFKMTRSIGLSKTLQNMGVKRIFENADLTGISKNANLQVTDVIHKAFVEVNEEGTEAAAATVVFVGKTCCAPKREAEPVKFYADHPFVFMIRENSTGSILFMGKIANPTQ